MVDEVVHEVAEECGGVQAAERAIVPLKSTIGGADTGYWRGYRSMPVTPPVRMRVGVIRAVFAVDFQQWRQAMNSSTGSCSAAPQIWMGRAH